jgi:hypothetical protein
MYHTKTFYSRNLFSTSAFVTINAHKTTLGEAPEVTGNDRLDKCVNITNSGKLTSLLWYMANYD